MDKVESPRKKGWNHYTDRGCLGLVAAVLILRFLSALREQSGRFEGRTWTSNRQESKFRVNHSTRLPVVPWPSCRWYLSLKE